MLIQTKVVMHVETVVLLSDKKVDGYLNVDLEMK